MFIMDDMIVVSPLVSIPPETEVPEWHGHGHGRGQWTWIMDMLKSWQSSHPSPTMQRLLWHVQWRVEEQVETREADQIPGPVDRLWPIFKLDKNQPSIHPSIHLHVTFCHLYLPISLPIQLRSLWNFKLKLLCYKPIIPTCIFAIWGDYPMS